jgi:DNA invertase Pin-like site-specific DNA recombinase
MAKRRRTTSDPNVVVAYTRVSVDSQVESGAGLEAQETAIRSECRRRSVTLARIYTDAGLSGQNMNRPALTECLTGLDAGQAGALVVAKVDRLSRSLLDFATLMDRAKNNGWKVIAIDLGVDTTTASGELTAAVVAAAAQYERRLISSRTKDALAARKAAGVKLGRPRLLDDRVARRIQAQRRSGATLQAIADGLNAKGVLTPTRKRWSPTLVRQVTVRLDQAPSDLRKARRPTQSPTNRDQVLPAGW